MWITVILLCIASPQINGAKILGVLMTESKSHYLNLRNVADELVSRGYQVCDPRSRLNYYSIVTTSKTDH